MGKAGSGKQFHYSLKLQDHPATEYACCVHASCDNLPAYFNHLADSLRGWPACPLLLIRTFPLLLASPCASPRDYLLWLSATRVGFFSTVGSKIGSTRSRQEKKKTPRKPPMTAAPSSFLAATASRF